MLKKHHKVTFQPYGKVSYVSEGTKVTEAISQVGLSINVPCGGTGTCGKCKIRVSPNPTPPNSLETNAISKEDLKRGWRLACQYTLNCDTIIEIPVTSQIATDHKILTSSDTNKNRKLIPSVYKKFITLVQPSLKDNRSDLDRLSDEIGKYEISLQLLRELPRKLRESNYKGTAVISDQILIDFESGDTTDKCYGVAFDIGTTTVVGTLMDVSNGKELEVCSRINPQVTYGDDVLSRIEYCSSGKNALQDLHNAIVGCVCDIINNLCKDANISKNHIYEVNIAGNTAMEHLFSGIDPRPLGQLPFTPAFTQGLVLQTKDIPLPINPQGRIYIFPVIGGFVGGDTTACILTSEMWNTKETTLLVDIGTNGEIVLAHNGKLLAASTAAGPALEGARISCGMRATTGAIEKVVFEDERIELSVIGDVEPIGICGSALIDIVSNLVKIGVISSSGSFLTGDELDNKIPNSLEKRLLTNESGQKEFILFKKVNGDNISLTQKDIRELQLAIGAIRAGIMILLKKAQVSINDIDKILMAGGFGSFIRRSSAQEIGLLPCVEERETICYVGNASLAGAKWALLNIDARKQAETLAQKTKHLELSLDDDFQIEFASAMIFPEPLNRG